MIRSFAQNEMKDVTKWANLFLEEFSFYFASEEMSYKAAPAAGCSHLQVVFLHVDP